ncbi:MC013 [Molluscum contagiosum virus subtype 2]|uniref:MC013 n=2 Tax=Molluscum contagiosum virus TaxID=10279 RepID=A0A1S7DLK0_MCV2|nr:MC013 [Molluscum contagiosum virus subtype 2]QHW16396.1 MC013L [Molluscum contagiosum virus]AYO87645.1 MC013 [Molluscum contagiosum virus subtype 2]AYO87815.1 MC013 [Molluscum contagiosum virus subtype 2]AYO87985.1 MC013 [Molluscum contagiosum virus subtype 2]
MDPHEVLGLPAGSSPSAVRARYKDLCLRYHPDRNPDAGVDFQAITRAYRQLRAMRRFCVRLSLHDVFTGRLVRFPVHGKYFSLFLPPGMVTRKCYRRVDGVLCEFDVRVLPDAGYTRRGHDLETGVDLSLEEAVAGLARVLHLPGGRLLTVKLAPFQALETRSLRFPGYGLHYSGMAGELRVALRVRVPDALRAQPAQLLSALRTAFAGAGMHERASAPLRSSPQN